jgi:hypothetical protein
MTKLFCIGFHKTGTTSMEKALTLLGYRVTGPNGVRDPDIAGKVYEMAYALAEQYDAFADNPWPLLYREMDRRYPGSKFILTVRPADAWIRSLIFHFGERSTPMRKWIYGVGSVQGNEEVYRARYESHNAAVREYFHDRPGDLLVLDLTDGDNWRKLCAFLGKPVPDVPFPRENTRIGRLQKKQNKQAAQASVWRRILRRAVQR